MVVINGVHNQNICLFCRVGTITDIVLPGGQPGYLHFSIREQSNVMGGLVIGGPSIAAKAKICNNCGYLHFFYDKEATHGKKS